MGDLIDLKSKGPNWKDIEKSKILRTRAIKSTLFSNKIIREKDHVYFLKKSSIVCCFICCLKCLSTLRWSWWQTTCVLFPSRLNKENLCKSSIASNNSSLFGHGTGSSSSSRFSVFMRISIRTFERSNIFTCQEKYACVSVFNFYVIQVDWSKSSRYPVFLTHGTR